MSWANSPIWLTTKIQRYEIKIDQSDSYVIKTVLSTLDRKDIPEAFQKFDSLMFDMDDSTQQFNFKFKKSDNQFLEVLILLVIDFQKQYFEQDDDIERCKRIETNF